MSFRGAVAILTLSSLVAAGCFGDDGPGAEQARLELDGSATVTASDGSTEAVTGDTTLDFGDRVRIDEGSAVMRLAGGEGYELRADPAPSEVEVGAPPTLLAGDVLVSSGFPAQVRYESTTMSAQGAMKVVSGVPAAVSYVGRARIDGAGQLEEVLGLRRVVLTSSATPEPIEYDSSDSWDRRFLAEAIAFGQRLEALARGYTADLGPGGGRSASFFEAVLPALDTEREFSGDLLDDDRDVGETLVGAAIAVQGRDGTFRERWDEVFAFRDAGAAWGLVALDQGVSSAPLLDTIELAISSPPVTSPDPVDPSPPTTTTTTTTPGDTSPTTGTTTTTTAPPPEPPPTTGLLDPVIDPVGEILDDLLGSLGL